MIHVDLHRLMLHWLSVGSNLHCLGLLDLQLLFGRLDFLRLGLGGLQLQLWHNLLW